jgi:hypothetical protein
MSRQCGEQCETMLHFTQFSPSDQSNQSLRNIHEPFQAKTPENPHEYCVAAISTHNLEVELCLA